MEVNKFRADIMMPEAYYIAYMAEVEKGKMTQIVKAADEIGNIFYREGKKKRYFRKCGAGYRSYIVEEDGMLIADGNDEYAPSYVEEKTKLFTDCARKSIMQKIGKRELLSEECLLGRKCEKYALTVKVAVFSQDFICMVDNETGICMEWKQEANLNGFIVTPMGNFECIEFQTGKIAERIQRELPQYIPQTF